MRCVVQQFLANQSVRRESGHGCQAMLVVGHHLPSVGWHGLMLPHRPAAPRARAVHWSIGAVVHFLPMLRGIVAVMVWW